MLSGHKRRLVAYTWLFVALAGLLLARGLHKGGLFEEGEFNDFRAYHLAAQGVWERDLAPAYRDALRPYQYPPPFALLVAPFGLLPYRAALPLWVLLNLAVVVFIFRRLEALLGMPLSPESRIAGFILVYRMVESDFANGNANVLVLALALGATSLARRRRPLAGGALLAAAALAKVSPVVGGLWIVYRARWRMLLGAALGLVALGVLLPTLVLGPRGVEEAWGAWRETTVLPALAARDPEVDGGGHVPGQGLRALLHRLLTPADATSHDGAVVTIHVASLPLAAVDLIHAALSLAIAGALLLASWRRAPGRGLSFQPFEAASALAAMALLGPLSRTAHFALLWPAAVLGFEAWWRLEGREGRRLRLAGSLLWGAALVLVLGTSPGLLGRELAARAEAYCPLSWAAGCLLILLAHPRLYPPRITGLAGAAPACGGAGGGGAGGGGSARAS
jgi:hypothetical protein